MPKGKKKAALPPALTANQAASFASTGNARVNFFFKAVRGLGENEPVLSLLLKNAWDEDALDTLRLIFQTRDCRGGKGEKAIFRTSLKWLAAEHPEVLQKNIQHIPFFGSWKDMLALHATTFENASLDLFAEQLRKDLEVATANKDNEKKPSISLAAKWAPSENHKDDRLTKVSAKIAKRLFPESKRCLADYRKNVLTPLRVYLRVTEVKMCANEWTTIDYPSVPSRCMNLSRKAFIKHDENRFNKFIEDAKAGKVEIKGKQMFPHELAKYYFSGGAVDDVIELQWKTIVDGVKNSGSLTDSIVLSDVSGSMSGTPMEVSVALGLLISEVTAEPFRNVVVTFHENPTFHQVKGSSLKDRVANIMAMPWGGSTNFQAVFDMILERARAHKLPPAAMPKRLFVISDMQFDQADSGGKFKTNHQALKAKYKASGYEVPQIIYWNVTSGTNDFPVGANEQGVALVSGFSPSILKDIVESGELTDPETLMKKVIDGERYKILTL